MSTVESAPLILTAGKLSQSLFQSRDSYGTILDNNTEEAADLYVYRVAEYKAIQIGRVTRLLKESAVDCILNHNQSNFTQENIERENKKNHNDDK